MKFSMKWIGIAYAITVLLDLIFIYTQQNNLIWIVKPLLMPLLMLGVYTQRKLIKFWPLLFAALFLSWAGDVFLLVNGWFIPGLVSFLLAHVCYIIYFSKLNSKQKGLLQFEPLIGIPVVVYIIIFLWLLYPFLDTMKIPVTVYAITIGLMLLMSIHTRRKINDDAATLFFNGALQFVLSDSILAVNLFAFPSAILSLCVMITYSTAQYLIVKGSMKTAL
jgi:uncharacterized membrane protein YhhN